MIRNYFISAIRNLLRNKSFALINILGLATGLACVILFFLWVTDEISYDRFHDNKDRIYNLLSVFDRADRSSMSVTPFPLAPNLSDRYPEVEEYTRYWKYPSLVEYDEVSDLDEKIHLVDPGFFKMFSFPLISGSFNESMLSRSTVILTESAALKYFGDEDPIGKILTLNKWLKLSVTGVMKDPPKNSIFDFSMLASILHVDEFRLNDDWSYAGPSYLMLTQGSVMEDFQEKVEGIYVERNPEGTTKLILQEFKEIYLYKDGIANRIIYVYLFSGIAIVILLLACINYMNLSTARSIKRSKEIGLRKSNGAKRSQIITQFIGESFMYSFVSIGLALIIVELARPVFNELTLKQLEIHYNDPVLLGGLIVIYLFASLSSGLYPAFVLSSYKPILALRGSSGSIGNKRLLNSLIVLQFTISIALIISAVTINRQVSYIHNKDLGLNKENVIILPFSPEMISAYDVLRDRIMTHPAVINVSASYDLPFHLTSAVSFTWDNIPVEERIGVSYNMVDFDFVETMEIEMLDGRPFSREYASDDSTAYIINETALNLMGVDRAVGKSIRFLHPHLPDYLKNGTIVGVVKDFNIRPVKEEIGPLVMKIYRPFYRHIYIRYDSKGIQELLDFLQEIQDEAYPGFPLYYSFLDDEADQIYSVEFRTGKIILYFTIISIIISFLGLLGMAIYNLELKKREIAIRKVMASSVSQIVRMILLNYIKLILISFVIAAPIAFYFTEKWLQQFVYGVKISVYTYVLSLVSVVIITSLTIGFLARRSGRINPSEILKND